MPKVTAVRSISFSLELFTQNSTAVYFNIGLDADIHSYLTGTNNHAASNFISFTPESGLWFVKYKAYGWYANVSDSCEKTIGKLRTQVREFDAGLDGMLFGYDGNRIYIFQRGYAFHLEGAAEHPEHPLHKASDPKTPYTFASIKSFS